MHDRKEAVVLDNVDNFDGLEELIVIAVGLDAVIGDGTERHTQSQIYRAVTRAHMMVVVVNECIRGGWLEHLSCLEFDAEMEFDSNHYISLSAAIAATVAHAAASQRSNSAAVAPV